MTAHSDVNLDCTFLCECLVSTRKTTFHEGKRGVSEDRFVARAFVSIILSK